MYRMPTEWEQDVARAYVNERELVRPSLSIKTALIAVLGLVLVAGLAMWLVCYTLITLDFISFFPRAQAFYNAYPFLSISIICAGVVAIETFFCLKYAVIGAIKLYQRYALEEVRRRCLFKPTCSEYTIMAVRKYGVMVGLCKGYYRLMYLCRGNIYKIHYP